MKGSDLIGADKIRVADELLGEWWRWSRSYRPHLGFPRISAGMKYPENRQWDSENEIADETIRKLTMESVEWCINALPVPMQQVIGLTMRNRASKVSVWRQRIEIGCAYSDALAAVIPLMERKNLI